MQVHANCIALALADTEAIACQVEELVLSGFKAEGERCSVLAACLQRERNLELRWQSSRDDADVLRKQV